LCFTTGELHKSMTSMTQQRRKVNRRPVENLLAVCTLINNLSTGLHVELGILTSYQHFVHRLSTGRLRARALRARFLFLPCHQATQDKGEGVAGPGSARSAPSSSCARRREDEPEPPRRSKPPRRWSLTTLWGVCASTSIPPPGIARDGGARAARTPPPALANSKGPGPERRRPTAERGGGPWQGGVAPRNALK